jgi:hypothetical protein
MKEAKYMEILQGKNKINKNTVFIDKSFLSDNRLAIIMEKCDNNLFKHLISISIKAFYS